MRLAQHGDKKAYTDLFHAITPALRGFVGRRLADVTEREDLVQDILLSIHRASHTYDTGRPFKIWMFTIARYRLNDYLRRVYKKGPGPFISLDEISNEVSAPDVTERRDQYEYLENALKTLPERQRKIVTMMKIEGYTAEETARTVNMSVSAVKVAAHRAYKALSVRLRQGKE